MPEKKKKKLPFQSLNEQQQGAEGTQSTKTNQGSHSQDLIFLDPLADM